MYLRSMFIVKIRKKSCFLSTNFHFTAVKNCSILHRHVIVMELEDGHANRTPTKCLYHIGYGG